jgi:hypothetical protein
MMTMTTNRDTGAIWDEAARAARKQAIAEHVVVAIRPISAAELTLEQRATIALQSLERAVMQFDILGDDIAGPEIIARLDEIDTRLRRRRFALNMRLGLVHLAGVMGRVLP